jgi:hypothetical protein
MLALQLKQDFEYESDTEWALPPRLDFWQMDCLTTIMLNILDENCAMDSASKDHIIEIYTAMEKTESTLFDQGIHVLISRVLEKPELLLLRHVHELRLYAESAIPKSRMNQFKQYLYTLMPCC